MELLGTEILSLIIVCAMLYDLRGVQLLDQSRRRHGLVCVIVT